MSSVETGQMSASMSSCELKLKEIGVVLNRPSCDNLVCVCVCVDAFCCDAVSFNGYSRIPVSVKETANQ